MQIRKLAKIALLNSIAYLYSSFVPSIFSSNWLYCRLINILVKFIFHSLAIYDQNNFKILEKSQVFFYKAYLYCSKSTYFRFFLEKPKTEPKLEFFPSKPNRNRTETKIRKPNSTNSWDRNIGPPQISIGSHFHSQHVDCTVGASNFVTRFGLYGYERRFCLMCALIH